MGFYDLAKEDREKIVGNIKNIVQCGIENLNIEQIYKITSDQDTYIRKNCYLAIGKLYREREDLREKILIVLSKLFDSASESVRQTVAYAAGEIGYGELSVM